MHGYAAPLRDPFFFISDPKNKNCKIFYTKFKFYMGVAIERDKDSMNNHSSAFAYMVPKKKICRRYNFTAFPFSCGFFWNWLTQRFFISLFKKIKYIYNHVLNMSILEVKIHMKLTENYFFYLKRGL